MRIIFLVRNLEKQLFENNRENSGTYVPRSCVRFKLESSTALFRDIASFRVNCSLVRRMGLRGKRSRVLRGASYRMMHRETKFRSTWSRISKSVDTKISRLREGACVEWKGCQPAAGGATYLELWRRLIIQNIQLYLPENSHRPACPVQGPGHEDGYTAQTTERIGPERMLRTSKHEISRDLGRSRLFKNAAE